MIKIIATLALLLTIAFAQSCNNPLLRKFAFQALSNPQSGTSFNFCKSLNGTDSCCSADTINSFQQRTDQLINRLSDLSAEKDIHIIETRKSVLNLRTKLERLKTASDNALTALVTDFFMNITNSTNSTFDSNSTIIPNITGNSTEGDLFISLVYGLGEMASQITGQFSTLQSNFAKYQTTRAQCIEQMVKIQASAWCLACDPVYDTKGLSADGVLALSSRLQSRIIDSCYDFLQYSSSQNTILALNLLSSAFDRFSAAMETIGKMDPKGLTELMTALTFTATSSAPTKDTQIPTEFPPNCDRTSCDWLFTSMFNKGLLDEKLLFAGGVFETTTGRLLVEEESQVVPKLLDGSFWRKGRKLQNGDWNPAENEAGVSAVFPVNPGNVINEENSSLRNSIFAGLLSLLMVFLV